MAPSVEEPSIEVRNLTFAFPDGTTGLQNISLQLPAGSRTLLIGGKAILPSHSNLHGMLNPQEQMARARRRFCVCCQENACRHLVP